MPAVSLSIRGIRIEAYNSDAYGISFYGPMLLPRPPDGIKLINFYSGRLEDSFYIPRPYFEVAYFDSGLPSGGILKQGNEGYWWYYIKDNKEMTLGCHRGAVSFSYSEWDKIAEAINIYPKGKQLEFVFMKEKQ